MLPDFKLSLEPQRPGLCQAEVTLLPTLEIVMMVEDLLTLEDALGCTKLKLVMLKEIRRVNVEYKLCVNLFHASSHSVVSVWHAAFPWEVTGY